MAELILTGVSHDVESDAVRLRENPERANDSRVRNEYAMALASGTSSDVEESPGDTRTALCYDRA